MQGGQLPETFPVSKAQQGSHRWFHSSSQIGLMNHFGTMSSFLAKQVQSRHDVLFTPAHLQSERYRRFFSDCYVNICNFLFSSLLPIGSGYV